MPADTTLSVLFWRRLDVEGLERLELRAGPDGVDARATVLALEHGGFRIDHHWRLDRHWHALSVMVERHGREGQAHVRLERDGSGWRVNGASRPDLEGTEEPDLSVTPFCNTLPILAMEREGHDDRSFEMAFVDGIDLSVRRSRQRYRREGERRWRYIDLGVAKGFEADLLVDDAGLVVSYQDLFERVEGSSARKASPKGDAGVPDERQVCPSSRSEVGGPEQRQLEPSDELAEADRTLQGRRRAYRENYCRK